MQTPCNRTILSRDGVALDIVEAHQCRTNRLADRVFRSSACDALDGLTPRTNAILAIHEDNAFAKAPKKRAEIGEQNSVRIFRCYLELIVVISLHAKLGVNPQVGPETVGCCLCSFANVGSFFSQIQTGALMASTSHHKRVAIMRIATIKRDGQPVVAIETTDGYIPLDAENGFSPSTFELITNWKDLKDEVMKKNG